MRTNVLHRFLGLAALLMLAACAEPAIPYDRGAPPPVQTIGVLTPAWTETPAVVLASNVGQSLGLIGALVEAGMQKARNDKFDALLKARAYGPRDHFESYLRTALLADGYNVVPVSMTRSGFSFVDHPEGNAAVDAWLDCIGFEWGYLAAGIGDSTPYRPEVHLKCRLVRATDRRILMQDIVFYNPVGPTSHFVTIAPDPAYAFVDFDTLTGHPDQAVQGLDAALHQSADTIGTLLK